MSRAAVLVTGGSAGIGRGIVEKMLSLGHAVVSLDRDPAPQPHAALHTERVDLLDLEATRGTMAALVARFDFGIVVHNAGLVRPARLPDVEVADLRALADLHLAAPLAITQAVLPSMQAAGFGRIVMISSRSAQGLATRSAYSATKAGMLGMMRTWALELAPAGITVNAVAPGPVSTAAAHAIVPAGSEAEARMLAGIPVRRWGTPGDVAHAVAFLADPASGFVTGQTLYVCGGTSIGSVSW